MVRTAPGVLAPPEMTRFEVEIDRRKADQVLGRQLMQAMPADGAISDGSLGVYEDRGAFVSMTAPNADVARDAVARALKAIGRQDVTVGPATPLNREPRWPRN